MIPKEKVLKKIFFTISAILIITICLSLLCGCSQKAKNGKETLSDWLLENGELVNGTDLLYQEGNFTLSTNYAGDLSVEYIIPDYNGYEVTIWLPLFKKDEEVRALITIKNGNSKGTFSCYHYPENFTLKTPLSFKQDNQEPSLQTIFMSDYGVTKAEGHKMVFCVYEHKREEYEAKLKYNEEVHRLIAERESIAVAVSHESIASILDWLNEETHMKAADFGYKQYRPNKP